MARGTSVRRAGVVGAMAAVALGLAGCVVVIGNHSNTRYSDEDWVDRSGGGGEKPRMIGISTEPIGPALASQLGVEPDKCTLVSEVVSGMPAERAGIKQYDVITAIDGVESAPPGRLRAVIRAKPPGDDSVRLKVMRNGQPMEVCVPLEKVEGKGYSG